MDDVFHWVPARIVARLISIASRGEWRIMWRDDHYYLSPHVGWPESTMAGALGVILGIGPRPISCDVRREMRVFLTSGFCCGWVWGR